MFRKQALLLLFTSIAFGQEAQPPAMPSAHFPCEIEKWASCDVWVDFLYWEALQDHLEPCSTVSSFIQEGFEGNNSSELVNMEFNYKPAFRIGLGVNLDREYLDISADYIRFYSTDKISGSGTAFYPAQLDSATLLTFINGITVAGGGYGNAFPYSFQQQWALKMNFLDVSLGKTNYDGKIFKGHPFFGLRAGWIDQQLLADYIANFTNGGLEVGTSAINIKTKSWGIGLRAGLDTDWKIGGGFQFYGNGAGDFLYSRYHWHGTSNVTVPGADTFWNSNAFQTNIQEIQLHTELELGFKWSKWFNHNNARFDLAAGYGFQVFFEQNMFRFFPTAYEQVAVVGGAAELIGVVGAPISIEPSGNLYIHGLRVTMGFTF